MLDIILSVNVNASAAMNDSVNYVEMCNKCLELEAELIKQHNMVEKDEYNRLSKSFSKLEQHCISLELAMQLNKEIFQKNDTSVNQTEPTFDHLFELNNLKAELQAKDTTIEKLKANIKRLNKTSTTNSVKKDIDEIETINIELEHRVAKLIAENEHLKQTYKQLYDSIKPSRVRSKEHAESLVNQLNQKSVEITDLNAQLQEKVFVITTLKNDLRKFKGKDIVDNAAQVSNATTIAPGMYKLDPVTLAPKDKNNRETHIYYLKHTMEQAAILREIVEQAKSLNPLDSASYSACNSMFDARHELCLSEFVSEMNASSKSKSVKKAKKKEEWKPTGKVFTKIGYIWKATGRTFTLLGNVCPLTRITATNKVPLREPIPLEVDAHESVVTKVYTRRPKVVQLVLWYLDSGCSKHMTGDRSQLTNFVHKFLGTVKFGNDQLAKIMGYEGVDLLSGSRETNLYTLSIGDMMASSPICLLSKASKTKSWLWHRRLSHLNFGAINHLAKNGLVRGLPKLKFEKDHLCSACAMGKSKKQSHKPKSEDTNQEKLYLLHMDLCGPMRVASINGKNTIHDIVLNAPVRNIHTDNGTEFVNQTLRSYYESVGISHETSVARSPQQNGVVERRNHTLVEAARTMLIYVKAPLFLWAEAVATTCYTQNRSIIRRRHRKTPYELLHDRKPDLSYLHVFGALCYPNNDSEDLGKLQAKADIGIFIGYAPKKKAYRIYNRRPRLQSMTPATSSSGLVSNPIPQQPCNPPPRDDWDRLFQPMFDEYFNSSTIAVSLIQVAAAPRAVDLANSLVSTSIDQDAPSTSIPSRQDQEHSLIISQGFEESPKTPHFHDDPLHTNCQT
ncbi:retrovirus-related pol polyprotein from transposon TNT 1-94 [Tanacetum coccineum]